LYLACHLKPLRDKGNAEFLGIRDQPAAAWTHRRHTAAEAMSDGDSDDGRRAAKKRKASRACDRCNSQHQPCDNAVPKCSVCVRAGTECTYNRPVRKRGPRSGYTGQNGERLWAIMLQARPEIEDIVLQALRGGTYGDTGIPNLEYYRNNDNQTELVNKFNESRLGRFLQNGESADLNLPPLDEELPLVSPFHCSDTVMSQSSNNIGLRQSNAAVQALPHQHGRRMSNSSGANSVIVNPHGAPQNPSDIYLQSEDIRRRAFNAPQDGARYQGSPALQGTGFGSDGYDLKSQISDSEAAGNMASYNSIPSVLSHSSGQENGHNEEKAGSSELETPYHSRWSVNVFPSSDSPTLLRLTSIQLLRLDSIPRDTLLNLGFAPGEGMEEDFFELCANPDPIESTPTNFADGQSEDEEAVWRRLVMRGRFV